MHRHPFSAFFPRVASCLLFMAVQGFAATPPAPYGPVPTPDQIAWQEMEQYAFIHFGINTFTNQEWGFGDEDPKLFNPIDFDADQIVKTCRDAGLTGVIMVVKHHDGFCLWPSAYTERSVKNSPYKKGKGDLAKEISDACHKYGLKFGVYLSPWDRNQPTYGKPEYMTYFRNQLQELLTNYGPVFEVWFDGANGGLGYYGGARENRSIDTLTYYQWDKTFKFIKELQPHTIIWSPSSVVTVPADVRWVGNESGKGSDKSYAVVNKLAGGVTGAWWMPPESDVSIRFSWFYHRDQDYLVKSPARLVHIYFDTVGKNTNLLLNIPPNIRGLIDEHDVAALTGWKTLLDRIFAKNLAEGATATASDTRGNDPQYAPGNVLLGKKDAYWAVDDTVTTPDLIVDFGKPVTFNIVDIGEQIALGQRVEGFALDTFENGNWVEIPKVEGSTVGYKRLVVLPRDVTTPKIRLRITHAGAAPTIARFGVYEAPYPILEEAGLR